MNPKVSICTHARNRLSHLRQSLDSILQQTYSNLEIIVIDYDCKEGTSEYINAHIDDHRLRVYQHFDREKPWSRSVAKNRAISYATGDWVLVVDCDNILAPNFIENHVHYLRDKSNFFLFGGARQRQENGSQTDIPYGLTFAKRTDLIEVDGYNEALNQGWGWEDDDLALRLLDQGLRSASFLGAVSDIKHGDQLRHGKLANKGSKDLSLKSNELLSFIEFEGLKGVKRVNQDFFNSLRKNRGFTHCEYVKLTDIRPLFSNRSMDHALPYNKIKTFFSCDMEYAKNGQCQNKRIYIIAHMSLNKGCYYLFVDRINKIKIFDAEDQHDCTRFLHELYRHKTYCLKTICRKTHKIFRQQNATICQDFIEKSDEDNDRDLATSFLYLVKVIALNSSQNCDLAIDHSIAAESNPSKIFLKNFTFTRYDYTYKYLYWVLSLFLSGSALYRRQPAKWIDYGNRDSMTR